MTRNTPMPPAATRRRRPWATATTRRLTAKACWEKLKKTLTPEQAENHPARWRLAEVCNVHSPAIEIEPIHRVLFNVDCATVLLEPH